MGLHSWLPDSETDPLEDMPKWQTILLTPVYLLNVMHLLIIILSTLILYQLQRLFNWLCRLIKHGFMGDHNLFEQTLKNIDDKLWKDAGCSSELDYVEQTSWILFLK